MTDQPLVPPVLDFVESLVDGLAASPRTVAASPWALARLPVAVGLTGGRQGPDLAGPAAVALWQGFLDAFPIGGRVPTDPLPGTLGSGVLRSRVGIDRSVLESFFARLVVAPGPDAATTFCLAIMRLARDTDAALRDVEPPVWPVEVPLADLRDTLVSRLGRFGDDGAWRARVSASDRRFDGWTVPPYDAVLAKAG